MEICSHLTLPRSRYYRYAKQQTVCVERIKLKACMQQIHDETHATYGSRRMQAELNRQGVVIGRHKVRKLMKSLSLKAKWTKPHRYLIASQPSTCVPNVLNRQFNPLQMNKAWSGDITYIRTVQGWLYLAIVLDLYSRRVISWAFSTRANSELSIRALEIAVAHRRPKGALLFHTDQGVQYASNAFQSALARNNITASMSRRGNCLDNAVTERFFRSLKSERVNHRHYKTTDEAIQDIAEYIEPFYNQKRLHTKLNNLAPAQYEQIDQKNLS